MAPTGGTSAILRPMQVAGPAATSATSAPCLRSAAPINARATTACRPALARRPAHRARREPPAAAVGANLTASLVRFCAHPSVRLTAHLAGAHSRAARWPATSASAADRFAERQATFAKQTASAAPVSVRTIVARASPLFAFQRRKRAPTPASRAALEPAIRRRGVAIWASALAVNR
jgi:hypothetical protein